MRYLLDTPVLLGILSNHPQIQPIIKDFQSQDNTFFVSTASLWQLQGQIPVSSEGIRDGMRLAGIRELSMHASHVQVADRPDFYIPSETGPVTRLLIGTAVSEPMTLLTLDKSLEGCHELIKIIE